MPQRDIRWIQRFSNFQKALNQLSKFFDDLMLPYTIDRSIYSQIDNADLIDHIRRVGKVIYTA